MAKSEAHVPLWLLILPPPPINISLKTLKAAYGGQLSQALRKASETSSSLPTVAVLDVAIACPYLFTQAHVSRTAQYANLQALLGQVYKLICIICTGESIDVQNGNDVDARVLLINETTEKSLRLKVEMDDKISLVEGPIISLEALALCQGRWQRLLVMDGEDGDVMLGALRRLDRTLQGRSPTIERLQRESGVEKPDQAPPQSIGMPEAVSRRHYSVAVGGTFDHLHAGHKLLLTMTALVLEPASGSEISQNRTLTVGITGDELLKKKQFAEVLQSWEERQDSVRQFLLALLEMGPSTHISTSTKDFSDSDTLGKVVQDKLKSGLTIKYVELFDAFGPTITERKISALVVSVETRAGGKAVNEKRKDKGWSELEVFEVDVLDAEEGGNVTAGNDGDGFRNKISSTEIRRRLHDGPAPHPATTK